MTYCAEHGCSVLVQSGRCPLHANAVERDRGTRQARGYGNRWIRRATAFRARYPLCGMRPNDLRPVGSHCFDEGRVEIGYQVDHVIPHRGRADLFWDELGNWQTLCASCGARKTREGL